MVQAAFENENFYAYHELVRRTAVERRFDELVSVWDYVWDLEILYI